MEKNFNLEFMVQKLMDEIKPGEKTENGVWINTFFSKTFLDTIEDVIKDYNLEIER